MPRVFNSVRHRRRGNVVVLTAVLLVVVGGMVAFAVDVGAVMWKRTKVRAGLDSAALAAAHVLDQGGDEDDIKAAADEYLVANGIDTAELDEEEFIVEVGEWDSETRTFTETDLEDAFAVRVYLHLANNEMFFGAIFGRDKHEITREAVATLGGGPQDVAMVIDCSGSMSDNNRMEYTKDAADVLLGELKSDDRVGLTVYSWVDPVTGLETGHQETSLDFDHSDTSDLIPDLEPGYYTGDTNIAGGMRAALDEHRNNPRAEEDGEAPKIMVLLTDGMANLTEPPGTDPWDSITHYTNVAVSENVIIHAVTLGSDASQDAMRDAAEATGGTYNHIEDGDYSALEKLFRALGRGSGRARLVQ